MLCIHAASAQNQSRSSVYIRQATATIPVETGGTTDDDITRSEALDLILDRLQPSDRPALQAYLTAATAGHFFLGSQSGSENTALVDQFGDANIAVLNQYGTGNSTTAIQNGSRNLFGIWLTGDNNQLQVEQYGNENIYLLEFTGSGLDVPPILQQGEMNQALQIGMIREPFGISQRGNGMSIIIEHNNPNQ
jgi:hypothetical protein